jgi:hypothetical protein
MQFFMTASKQSQDGTAPACRQTPATHMINICEPLQVISVKLQVTTPWWRIFCDPKHVGVIFNYVPFKRLYNINFNI